MTSRERAEQLTQMKNEIYEDIEILSELQSKYIDEEEASYYKALDNAIGALRYEADKIIIRYE